MLDLEPIPVIILITPLIVLNLCSYNKRLAKKLLNQCQDQKNSACPFQQNSLCYTHTGQ